MQPEDFWISAPKKGIVVFALPGEPGLAELVGDFKIHFQDRQGDFYWFVQNIYFLLSPFYFSFTLIYQNHYDRTVTFRVILLYNFFIGTRIPS